MIPPWNQYSWTVCYVSRVWGDSFSRDSIDSFARETLISSHIHAPGPGVFLLGRGAVSSKSTIPPWNPWTVQLCTICIVLCVQRDSISWDSINSIARETLISSLVTWTRVSVVILAGPFTSAITLNSQLMTITFRHILRLDVGFHYWYIPGFGSRYSKLVLVSLRLIVFPLIFYNFI